MGREVLLSVEALIAAVVIVIVLFLVATFVRRRSIGRGKPLVLCAIRPIGENHWRVGMARYGSARLDWFRLGGFTVRARYHWDRAHLELQAPATLRGRDRIGLLPEAVGVQCRYGDNCFELALAPGAYTALRAWVESSPPGLNVNVA